ncbi:hypothetical protein LCGC14_0705750 [marine sediment metagenome]|uniref:Uncharacterized protein n=1 Tax=marine sediment metagenome TaxID=412755 RepID=A0A0F9QL57_9ZZZZ|nr:hypothetical protein [bacterium]
MGSIYSGSGGFVGAETKTIHKGKGSLISMIVSHNSYYIKTVTVYDSLSASGLVLMRLKVAPERSPFYVIFPSKYRPRFNTGLTVAAGDCDVVVIATGV